eukprot:COSAG02_NODE_3465_length_6695_cov_3.210734_8_plen_113_part_00
MTCEQSNNPPRHFYRMSNSFGIVSLGLKSVGSALLPTMHNRACGPRTPQSEERFCRQLNKTLALAHCVKVNASHSEGCAPHGQHFPTERRIQMILSEAQPLPCRDSPRRFCD